MAPGHNSDWSSACCLLPLVPIPNPPQGQMCILDVSAHAIGKLLAAEVHPIAMFLKPAEVAVIQQQNEH